MSRIFKEIKYMENLKWPTHMKSFPYINHFFNHNLLNLRRYNTVIHRKYIHKVHFDNKIFGKMNPSQSTLLIITGMEVPVPIFIENFNPPSGKSLICTCSNRSTKYQITQYNHVMDHEGHWKFLLNFH